MHTKWMAWASLYLALVVLVGCGTKGELYIPEKQYPLEPPKKP